MESPTTRPKSPPSCITAYRTRRGDRLGQASAAERDLLDFMREQVPDMEPGENTPMDLRVTSQRLRDEGHKGVRPGHVTRILRGVARDGQAEGGVSGTLTLRTLHAESVAVTLEREWSSLCSLADKRRSGASILLNLLLSKLGRGQRGNEHSGRDHVGAS